MSKPLTSVLVVTYNQERFVREALVSVLEQDYENLEIVVSDDASTDGTQDIIREVDREYPGRMKLILDLPHVGMIPNTNRCLDACTGKYLAWQAGDDVYLPGKISRQVEWMEADDSRVLCGHDVEEFDSDNGETLYRHGDVHELKAGHDMKWIMRGMPFCGIANMLRMNAVPERGFDERIKYTIDWKMIIDMLSNGGEYGYVDGVYARRRRHSTNITNRKTFEDMEDRVNDVLHMLELASEEHPELKSHCRMARARKLCRLGTWSLLKEHSRTMALKYYSTSLLSSHGALWKSYAGIAASLLPWFVVTRLIRDPVIPTMQHDGEQS